MARAIANRIITRDNAKLLKEVQNELSDDELYDRMKSIQDNPHMLFEAGLIRKTHDFLQSQS